MSFLGLRLQTVWFVDVPNNLNSMRFSPVLLAVFAASAAFGLAHPAEAKGSDTTDQAVGNPALATGHSTASRSGLSDLQRANQPRLLAMQPKAESFGAESSSRASIALQPDNLPRQSVSAPDSALETSSAQANSVQTNPVQIATVSSAPIASAPVTSAPVTVISEPITSAPTEPTRAEQRRSRQARLRQARSSISSAPKFGQTDLSEVQVAQAATPAQETTPAAPSEPTAPTDRTPTFQIDPNLPALPTAPSTVPSTNPATAPVTPPGVTPAPAQQTPSVTPTAPGAPQTVPPASAQPEARVQVAEVAVSGVEGDLRDRVYGAIKTQAGQTTTRSQLQADINAIFATGYFANVRAVPQDTPLGVRVTFEVEANPQLRAVQLSGSKVGKIRYQNEEVPIQQAVDSIFKDQYGNILNLNDFQRGVDALNKLYRDNGFVLAQIIGAPQVSPDGTATIEVAEGEIESIQIRFRNRDGQETDDKGNPIRGRTRDFIITREFQTKPGDVLNQQRLQADFQRAFALGIFEDLQPALVPAEDDPRKVNLIVNVTERKTGSIGASAGFSSADGPFGAISLQEQNLGGNDQTLSTQAQVGLRSLQFDVSFTDPWIATDPHHTSYTVNGFGRQSTSLVFDGGPNEVKLPDGNDSNTTGDRPRVYRLGGGVTFGRPLGNHWSASLGAQYQNVTIRDNSGDISQRDELGNLLTFNNSGSDNILSLQASVVNDLRNNTLNTTSGSLLRLSSEQAVPIAGIFFNRLRANYSYFIPVQFIQFAPACHKKDKTPADCPETLAFNLQGGTVLGDLPPYEAFSLGGTDSVRGYQSGELGSGRSFVTFSAEYRFPLFSIIGGALFFDAGSDLGTASEVPGDPAGIRGKPGSGFGYGAGLRINVPSIGQVRIDYAINDQGNNEVHFGIGQRF